MESLLKIQAELKAPKGQYNSFGKYNYRSCEDILEAVKPLLVKYESQLTLTDDLVGVGSRNYVKATATFTDKDGKSISVSAYAREAETRKGMDDSQVTGATSSYARKYALNGLFLIDDTKDADTDEYTNESNTKQSVSNTKQSAPARKVIEFTDEQKAEMKKWTDGTFTSDELAKFKKDCTTGDVSKLVSAMAEEYKKRKQPALSSEEEKKAEFIF